MRASRSPRGISFRVTLDKLRSSTTLDAAAAAAQKVIPVGSTTGFSVGDECLIRAVDNDDEYELVLIASINAGVSVTALNNLYYSYTSSDIFRHKGYFPTVTTLDKEFNPPARCINNYLGQLKFVENI